MFIAELQKNATREIIQGDSIRQETADISGGGHIAPKAEGIAGAKAAGADLLILGKVTSHKTEGSLNGFVTVRIVETKLRTNHRHGAQAQRSSDRLQRTPVRARCRQTRGCSRQ
jgi:hypothetical protein